MNASRAIYPAPLPASPPYNAPQSLSNRRFYTFRPANRRFRNLQAFTREKEFPRQPFAALPCLDPKTGEHPNPLHPDTRCTCIDCIAPASDAAGIASRAQLFQLRRPFPAHFAALKCPKHRSNARNPLHPLHVPCSALPCSPWPQACPVSPFSSEKRALFHVELVEVQRTEPQNSKCNAIHAKQCTATPCTAFLLIAQSTLCLIRLDRDPTTPPPTTPWGTPMV